ncbi:iron-containing alcohol dehydrogenase family protein [Campylobacter sp. FMV-PI01]|uniref:Iron-containing alcohol dehydrogenase family protein n=1 Tax=Campylobacter portucalensis TaxID=2608384 RepID=A0A6L5WIY6_9BACT|nr:hypothetical protein [Campylobacter portucalensis]MSN97119.1 iron-containing alcohol dehydrogenase family protein [Campylobacter portucalensis]
MSGKSKNFPDYFYENEEEIYELVDFYKSILPKNISDKNLEILKEKLLNLDFLA